ncbi:MAG: hypothetical protein KC925_00225 [Candidatus Doudnabacteria bacterium]|nr:hypothetical protein [Candidatus Doudnabacteria bacterium]
MHAKIDSPVSVSALFNGDKVRPQVFKWEGRTYPVNKVNLVYQERQGRDRVYHFAASNEEAFFKLSFDTGSLAWKLVDLYVE